MEFLNSYKAIFDQHLASHPFDKEPKNLYEPISYILELGGKRIRPLLLLMTTDACGTNPQKGLPAAMAVEVFHNFTLLHDDIMDEAPLRRGKETVHVKYDVNTAILSGDVMMIYAYQFLSQYDPEVQAKLMKVFNKMAIEVCEGQQLDVDFETQEKVAIDDYIKMITYKTSVLIGASMQMGAIIGGASETEAEHFYHFGKNIGIAFQMQDDELDTFGEPKVGKQPGGDIIQNKKTYLYLKSLELVDPALKMELESLYKSKPSNPTQKVHRVREIMKGAHVLVYSKEMKEAYKALALSHLEATGINEDQKTHYKSFAQYLLDRNV